jgi:uncharacterized protein with GYD domain
MAIIHPIDPQLLFAAFPIWIPKVTLPIKLKYRSQQTFWPINSRWIRMKSYIMLTTLTDDGRKTVKDNPERIEQVNKAVESWGAKIISQYALFGPYDFLTLLQADDDMTILKIATELSARGTLKTMTLPAIPIDEFVKELRK